MNKLKLKRKKDTHEILIRFPRKLFNLIAKEVIRSQKLNRSKSINSIVNEIVENFFKKDVDK